MNISPASHHLHSPRARWIGLTGFAGSGKSTLARHLVEEHDFLEVSFADPIRDALINLDPLVDTSISSDQMTLTAPERLSSVITFAGGWDAAKRSFPDVRRLLQRLGTEAIRSLDPDFWVRVALRKAHSTDRPVVFPDVRFENEIEAIRSRGGIIGRVERPGIGPVNAHTSETGLTTHPADLAVLNVGDVDQMSEHASIVASIVSLLTSQNGAS